MPTRTKTGVFDNEASAVDLKVYDALKDLKWAAGDTLLYQPNYALTAEEQADFPGSKSIKPDFVLQDLQGFPLAVIENKLDDPQKALPKLRLKYSRLLKPCLPTKAKARVTPKQSFLKMMKSMNRSRNGLSVHIQTRAWSCPWTS